MLKEKKVIIVLIWVSVNDINEIHTITDSQKISLHGVQFCN